MTGLLTTTGSARSSVSTRPNASATWRTRGSCSLSLLYWLQTEAPRPDQTRPRLPGAPSPERRRRAAPPTGSRPPPCLGVPTHRGRVHRLRATHRLPATARRTRDARRLRRRRLLSHRRAYPRTSGAGIPRPRLLAVPDFRSAALVPIRVENLLPAGKNLGVTHIANGAFRVHPVEWSVGEAAGTIVALCLERGVTPRQVRGTPQLLEELDLLRRRGRPARRALSCRVRRAASPRRSRRPRIGISGSYGGRNLGDEALSRASSCACARPSTLRSPSFRENAVDTR